MAENQPEGTAQNAPQNGASGPVNQPADQQPAAPTFTLEAFDEDQKKYLAGQGITTNEQLTPEALVKVVNHARSSQQTAQERQAELDRLRGGTPTGSTGPNSDGASGAQQPSQPQNGSELDPTNAFLITNALSVQFPKIAAKLADGSLYKEMQEDGTSLLKADGTVNLAGIQKYAGYITKQVELEEKLAAAPGEGGQPVANPPAPTGSLDASAEMNIGLARAIALKGASHPRFDEAKKFVEDSRK